MDRAGDQLLAGAGLARDENGDVDTGGLSDDLARLQHLWAAPELHLTSDSPAELLGSRPECLGLGADKLVDRLLELVETERLM